MKVLLFSDLHDSSRGLWALIDFLNKNQDIAGLVFAGDVTNMGEPVSFAEKFVNEISKFKHPLLWVPGNNDFGRSYEILQNYTKSLEGRIVKLGGRAFTGVGGSPDSWSGQYEGERSVDKKAIADSIFVSHVPPPGIITLSKFDDPLTQSVISSDKVSGEESRNQQKRRFSDPPLVHICGHVHWKWGVDYLGQTKIIKLASSETGHCAIMDLENLNVEFMRLM